MPWVCCGRKVLVPPLAQTIVAIAAAATAAVVVAIVVVVAVIALKIDYIGTAHAQRFLECFCTSESPVASGSIASLTGTTSSGPGYG